MLSTCVIVSKENISELSMNLPSKKCNVTTAKFAIKVFPSKYTSRVISSVNVFARSITSTDQ